MATTNLGRVVPINKGNYNPSTTYELNHLVTYNGTLWWHTGTEPTTGVTPTEGDVWHAVLEQNADKGLGITNAVVGQLVQVLEVDANGVPTKWTTTNGGGGGGGGGGTDIGLGITGATAGAYIRIRAVDASGTPTSWEVVEASDTGLSVVNGALCQTFDEQEV